MVFGKKKSEKLISFDDFLASISRSFTRAKEQIDESAIVEHQRIRGVIHKLSENDPSLEKLDSIFPLTTFEVEEVTVTMNVYVDKVEDETDEIAGKISRLEKKASGLGIKASGIEENLRTNINPKKIIINVDSEKLEHVPDNSIHKITYKLKPKTVKEYVRDGKTFYRLED